MIRELFDVLFRALLLGACAFALFVMATGCSLEPNARERAPLQTQHTAQQVTGDVDE